MSRATFWQISRGQRTPSAASCVHVSAMRNLGQAEQRACLLGARQFAAEIADDPLGLFAQRRVAGRQNTLLDIDVVLKADADMAAHAEGLRQHREFPASD